MNKTLIVYKTKGNKEPFNTWLFSLKDKTIRNRILVRLKRVEQGNYGDYKRIHGIVEIRLHFGAGYRIYCGEDRNILVVLLIGGDKSSQSLNIQEALKYWEDYNEQKKF